MAKGKKKDDGKKAALQARKDAKADKAAQKRLKKEQGISLEDTDEEKLDDLLDQYKKQDEHVTTTSYESLEGFPAPRGNASLTHIEDKNGFLYLFGGEYFDGIENIILDELLRWDVAKMEWKRILTPSPKPAPRCAHSCVSYKKSLYVFGGELATADNYHHYRDLWKFDTPSGKWQELITRNPPTARSGHAAFVWKSYMIVFGGFYEALKDTRWFNDVHVLDLQTLLWLDIPHSKLATRPEARSACNVGLHGDTALIQGGFSKLKNPTAKGEQKIHNDAWILHLKPILQGKPPTWEKMSARVTNGPKDRAGTASVAYKNRMLVFGGVQDEEQLHHKVASVFFNDLWAHDWERRKWFSIRPKAQVDTKKRRRKGAQDTDIEDQDDNSGEENTVTDKDEVGDDLDDELDDEEGAVSTTGWDLDMLRSNMFAFIDGEGNIVYEKIEDDEKRKEIDKVEEGNEDEEEKEEEEEKAADESEEEEKESDEVESYQIQDAIIPQAILPSKKVLQSQVMKLNEETGIPEAVARAEPLPRMNSKIMVRNNVLYMYGGILEVGDREVTLDDCWSFDLRKRTKWECLWEGSIHRQVWRGAIHDDDDSYISTGADEGSDDDDDDSEDEEEEQVRLEAKAVKKALRREAKKAGLRQEIATLRSQLDLDDANRTPAMGEAMANFYSRTSEFWTQQAAQELADRDTLTSNDQLSHKEMKREGFVLAQNRYDDLKPIIARLEELELQQQEAEDERKGSKIEKHKKKKSSKKSSK